MENRFLLIAGIVFIKALMMMVRLYMLRVLVFVTIGGIILELGSANIVNWIGSEGVDD